MSLQLLSCCFSSSGFPFHTLHCDYSDTHCHGNHFVVGVSWLWDELSGWTISGIPTDTNSVRRGAVVC